MDHLAKVLRKIYTKDVKAINCAIAGDPMMRSLFRSEEELKATGRAV